MNVPILCFVSSCNSRLDWIYLPVAGDAIPEHGIVVYRALAGSLLIMISTKPLQAEIK